MYSTCMFRTFCITIILLLPMHEVGLVSLIEVWVVGNVGVFFSEHIVSAASVRRASSLPSPSSSLSKSAVKTSRSSSAVDDENNVSLDLQGIKGGVVIYSGYICWSPLGSQVQFPHSLQCILVGLLVELRSQSVMLWVIISCVLTLAQRFFQGVDKINIH